MTINVQDNHNIDAIQGYFKTDNRKLQQFLTQNNQKINALSAEIRDLCSELNKLYQDALNKRDLADYMKALWNFAPNPL